MQYKYAVFSKHKDFLFDVKAKSSGEAIAKAKEIDSRAYYVRLIAPDNDYALGSFYEMN